MKGPLLDYCCLFQSKQTGIYILFCILREGEGQLYASKIKREIILLQEMQFKRIDKKIGRGKIEEVFSEEVQGYRDLKG